MLRFTVFLLWLSATACGSDQRADAPAPTSPRFYEEVAPILATQCVGCHREGGAAPFPLVTYEDAVAASASMPAQVTSRQMPPWGMDNSGDCNTFQHARWLSDAEIETISAWASGDQREGDPASAPPLPALPDALPRVNATAKMPVAYTPSATLDDDYRCFIVDPGLTADSFLTGFEVRPGAVSMVHHMLLFQLETPEAEAAAAQLDSASAGPGYTCFGGTETPSTSLIGVWAPGVRATRYPTNTGLPVKGGRKMIMQIHYHNHGEVLADQTAVDLMTDATVSERSFLFLLPALDLNLLPGQPAAKVVGELALPAFVGQYNVWGLFPHMHTRGTTLRVEVDHAGQTQCLGDVPRWDFNWQQGYFYDGPPRIAGGGDTLRIECTYDTTKEGQPITWGEGTDDEMCLAFLYVSPY